MITGFIHQKIANKQCLYSPAANDQNRSFFDKSMKLCQITNIPDTIIFGYGAIPN